MTKKIKSGKPLEELVKGSMEYTLNLIKSAFRAAFPTSYDSSEYLYIVDTKADFVVVEGGKGLRPDEFYKVAYERQGETFVFASRDKWEIVELDYQPQSRLLESLGKEKRFVEGFGSIELFEAVEGKPRRIKAIGITADVVNGNNRRYPAHVLEAAVREAQSHLNESLGQGRVQLLGEVEHPSSKSGRPSLFETVFKWENISFDGTHTLLEGIVLPTSKGRDIQALLENGVKPPLSQRARGNSVVIKEGGRQIEEVVDLHITGYDATLEPSDPEAAILESNQNSAGGTEPRPVKETNKMDPEELKKFIQDHPELFDEAVKAQAARLEQASAVQIKALEERVTQAQADATKAQAELDEQKRAEAVASAIAEATRDLPYSEQANALFVESVNASSLPSAEAVKTYAEGLRKVFDKRAADDTLRGMGFKPAGQVVVSGPVIEKELGIPEYAGPSFLLTESIRKAEMRARRDLRNPKTINEEFTVQYLKRFDEQHKRHLIRETREFDEAEQVSDLSLPYSVSRAVIAEAFPTLIAVSLFDFAMSEMVDSAKLYFEAFAGETGYSVSLAANDNVVITALNTWYDLAHKRLTPGTVVVKNAAENVTYTEGTDYVIDYGGGRIMALATINAGDTVHITAYDYTAIRKGEMQPIERAKVQLSTKTITLAADRLAAEISREAVVFSRGTMGYDATARTLASLVRQIARKIDQGVIYMALAAALSVPNNSGGTWVAANDPIGEFVEKLGVAKVKVAGDGRYYTPNGVLLSDTNGDKIANWDNFTAAGQRPDADLNAEGYIGRLKGLPVFQSTEMSDGYGLVANRQLVMHRVGQTMQIFGPFPSYEAATGKLIAANQYYAEEFNGSDAPVPEKGATVKII